MMRESRGLLPRGRGEKSTHTPRVDVWRGYS
jgi:hypothetical protein